MHNTHIAIGREHYEIHGKKEEKEKPNKNQWLNEPGCGEDWWNRVRNEQIDWENWLKSHDKIKEWMG